MKILVVDDEMELASIIGEILKSSDYKVVIANDGEEALKKIIESKFDAIIIDVMMPKMSGIEVVKELRDRNIDIPILMLTAKSEVVDKVEGLDAGANDYLTKPFNKNELLARIRAITRENKNKFKKIEIGNVVLDREENELYSKKASFHLNSKECQVLEILVSNGKSTFSKQELRAKVWGDDYKEEVVPMYISFLQNKLKALDADIVIKNDNGYCIKKLN